MTEAEIEIAEQDVVQTTTQDDTQVVVEQEQFDTKAWEEMKSEWSELAPKFLWQFVLPIVGLYVAWKALQAFITFAQSFFVEGKPSEWVLVMRNGNLVKAGIGLKTFKGPFDQVAMYPAHMHKVNFSTQQVTKEMQSVEVSGMLVWTVNRIGNGPLNAYKNLGSDLSTGNPREANNSLEKMASAVVRSCIANSTITEMLSKRQLLRDAIKNEMFDVVKGWGVWLETIEITGVKICNGKLFKDLQTTFREKVHKDAELHRMQINNEISKFTGEFDQKRDQIERDVA